MLRKAKIVLCDHDEAAHAQLSQLSEPHPFDGPLRGVRQEARAAENPNGAACETQADVAGKFRCSWQVALLAQPMLRTGSAA